MFARTKPEKRLCFADCGKPTPECHCRARLLEEVAEADRWRGEGIYESISGDLRGLRGEVD